MQKMDNILYNKKTLIIIVLAVAAIIFFITFGYTSIQKTQKFQSVDNFEAVPLDATIIFELQNIKEINNLTDKTKSLLHNLLATNELIGFKNDLNYINNVCDKNKTLNKLLNSSKIVVSAHNIGTDGICFLFSIKINRKITQNQIADAIYSLTKQKDSSYTNYFEKKIYKINSSKKSYYFSVVDNIFIFSENEILIESAIRQKLSNTPITQNTGFKRTNKYISLNKNHLFVNYKTLETFTNTIFNSKFYPKTAVLNNFADWSSFDLETDNEEISLSGYTFISNISHNFYLSMFLNSKPVKFNEQDFIPDKTAEFINFQINDFGKFYSLYEKYSSSKNLTTRLENSLDNFNQKYKVNLINDFYSVFDNSITFQKVKFNQFSDDFSYFVLLKTKDTKEFFEIMQKITASTLKDKDSLQYFSYLYNVDNSTSIRIYKLNTKKSFLSLLFNQLTDFPEDLNYYFIYKEHIFFGESKKELEQLYYSLYTNKTLGNNEDFKKFLNKLPQKSNIFYFSNNFFNYSRQLEILKNNYSDYYKKNINIYSKFEFVTAQFIYENELFQTHLNAYYNSKLSNIGFTSWEIKIKNNIAQKPLFFTNHQTKQKEIIILDDSNYLYLIDKKGTILWSKHITEQVTSPIYQVDLYNNDKYQIIFSTTNYILTFDRNGEVVNEKCTKLPGSSSKGLSVIDYDGKKDYRFFVPIANNVLLFDKNLKAVDGWNPPTTETEIQSNVFYFSYKQKDYIVFSDKSKVYIVNRKGEERITVKQNFQVPQNVSFYFQPQSGKVNSRIVTTDASGKVASIDLTGKVTFKNLASFSENHTFTASDVNNDNLLDYIFTDDKTLFVYDFNGKLIFSYTFSGNILSTPIILKFSKDDIEIGVTIPNENKIYLFNSDGSIHKNFPIDANSPFSIGLLVSNKTFSLITSLNNIIMNYSLN